MYCLLKTTVGKRGRPGLGCTERIPRGFYCYNITPTQLTAEVSIVETLLLNTINITEFYTRSLFKTDHISDHSTYKSKSHNHVRMGQQLEFWRIWGLRRRNEGRVGRRRRTLRLQ